MQQTNLDSWIAFRKCGKKEWYVLENKHIAVFAWLLNIVPRFFITKHNSENSFFFWFGVLQANQKSVTITKEVDSLPSIIIF